MRPNGGYWIVITEVVDNKGPKHSLSTVCPLLIYFNPSNSLFKTTVAEISRLAASGITID